MKCCVVLNPQAGTVGDVATIKRALQRLGDVSFRLTQQPGDAQKLAYEAVEDGCELVIAAGGDGTVNEVVNGLARDFSAAQLGIIPLGTGNDFVRSINVPTDLEAAMQIVQAGRAQKLDVVRVISDDTRYFINVSAGGFSGMVDEKLTSEMKRSWGPLAYLRSAAEALPNLTDYHTYIAFDDDAATEIKTYNIVIANARYVAGGIPIAPQAQIDDGQVDVLIIPVTSMPKLALLAPQILLGQHLDSDLLIVRRARKISVDSTPRMWFNADGELVGNEPSTFEVLPQALEVIVGNES